MSPSNFSFFKKDPSKSYTPTSTVVVRPLQGPPPMVHKKITPVQPAVVLPTKRRRVDGSGSLPMKKSRSNSADSTTPPPVRDRSAPRASSSARASVSARASRNGTPSTSRASSVIPRNAQGLSPAERNCMAKDVGRGLEGVLSSADVYRERLGGYIPYFTNPADPEDLTFSIVDGRCLTVSLELPARGATEEYILVTPRDPDHYDPLRDLEETLYTIVEHYLTPAQATLFGPIPTKLPTDSDTLQPSSDGTPSLLRLFKRTLTRRDGPAFISALASINRTLRSLKYPSLPSPSDTPLHNALSTNISRWTNTGMPFPVVSRILEESYQRIVRPQTHTLLEYEAFASTVYGELLPTFISRLLRTHTPHLRPGSLFLDLGSGVGQVCVQAALETGCDAYGIEIQHGAANVATQMADHVRKRAARGWGVKMGRVALEEGDMIASETVSKKIAQADVILVNNKVFTADLNDALRQKFLDCREGALVISLQPFSASDRAIDDPAAIFVHTQHEFYSGDVSWAATGGTYYVHVVDREGHRERVERMQSRPTRSRR